MTTLTEALARLPERAQHGPSCGMGVWLAAQEPGHRDAVQEWLDGGHESSAIHRRLKPVDGFDVSDFTLRRHRNGVCACD